MRAKSVGSRWAGVRLEEEEWSGFEVSVHPSSPSLLSSPLSSSWRLVSWLVIESACAEEEKEEEEAKGAEGDNGETGGTDGESSSTISSSIGGARTGSGDTGGGARTRYSFSAKGRICVSPSLRSALPISEGAGAGWVTASLRAEDWRSWDGCESSL